jgi:hypothetical protein
LIELYTLGENSTPRLALRAVSRRVHQASGKLLSSSLLAAALMAVGLLLIFPGLYFSWVYSFVPLWAIASPELSSFDILKLSKIQALRQRLLSLFCVFGVLLILLCLRFGIEVLLRQALPVSWLAPILIFAISIPLGALTNVLITEYFLKTREAVYEAFRRKIGADRAA